jgi:hypothetical protein
MDFGSRSIFLKTRYAALLLPATRCVVFTRAHHTRNSACEFLPEDATVVNSGG